MYEKKERTLTALPYNLVKAQLYVPYPMNYVSGYKKKKKFSSYQLPFHASLLSLSPTLNLLPLCIEPKLWLRVDTTTVSDDHSHQGVGVFKGWTCYEL